MDADAAYTEKNKRELHKNATSHIKQIQEEHPTKQLLYGHLYHIFKTNQIRWTRHVGHCGRSKNELIRDVLQWNPSHKHTSIWRPTRTYLQ